MQTPNIRFGQIYRIHSLAANAEQLAQEMVEEKQRQGIAADLDMPSVVVPGGAGVQAWVYTNENDNALDCFQRMLKAEEEGYALTDQEFPYLSGKPEIREQALQTKSQAAWDQHFAENRDRLIELMEGGQAGRDARNELSGLSSLAKDLYFNQQDASISEEEFDAADTGLY